MLKSNQTQKMNDISFAVVYVDIEGESRMVVINGVENNEIVASIGPFRSRQLLVQGLVSVPCTISKRTRHGKVRIHWTDSYSDHNSHQPKSMVLENLKLTIFKGMKTVLLDVDFDTFIHYVRSSKFNLNYKV